MTEPAKSCGERKRSPKKRKNRLVSVRQISVAILITALLRGLVELALAIRTLLT